MNRQLTEEEGPDSVHEVAASWLIAALGDWLGDDRFVAGSDLGRSRGPREGESQT